MDAIFRRDYPIADGFPTISASTLKGCSTAMAEAVDRISEVRRVLSQPVFRSFCVQKCARVVPTEAQACRQLVRSDLTDTQSAVWDLSGRCSPERSVLRSRYLHQL